MPRSLLRGSFTQTWWSDDDLVVGEIMTFDNHAFAMIVEESTGIGAMEVLVDPVSLEVFPEHGPNMMWNLKYSGMVGRGGHMGYGDTYAREDVSEEMSLTEQMAVETAQQYMDLQYPGVEVDDHAKTFYGYYTLHTLEDGEISGMLSVNGYSGDVYIHTWHGEYIEMNEIHDLQED